MAVWQYFLEILPESELKRKFVTVPDLLDLEAVSGEAFLKDLTLDELCYNTINKTLVRSPSWHDNLSLFGDLESDCIEIWHDSNRVISEISCRIDVRKNDSIIVESIFAFCTDNELLLYNKDRGARCSPANIANHITKSNAGKFVDDPEAFLNSLS